MKRIGPGDLLDMLNREIARSRARAKFLLRILIDAKYIRKKSIVDTSETPGFRTIRDAWFRVALLGLYLLRWLSIVRSNFFPCASAC
jgi:hypothetical protein